MKIAYIGLKNRERAKENIEELAERLAKKGHSVFFPAIFRLFTENYDIIHNCAGASTVLHILLRVFKPKTVLVQTPVPFGMEIKFTEESEYLKKWNLQKGSYIAYTGKLEKSQGVHSLIQAFKSLEDKHLGREKKLIVIGENVPESGYLNELKDTARGRANIIFAESQEKEALDQLLSHSYFIVSPFLLEGMGYGKAALEIGENADANQLENKLIYFINNPLVVKKVGEEALEKIREKYSFEKVAEKMENLYKEALSRKDSNYAKSSVIPAQAGIQCRDNNIHD